MQATMWRPEQRPWLMSLGFEVQHTLPERESRA